MEPQIEMLNQQAEALQAVSAPLAEQERVSPPSVVSNPGEGSSDQKNIPTVKMDTDKS